MIFKERLGELDSDFPRTVRVLRDFADFHNGGQIYVSRRGETLADAAFGVARPGVPMELDTLLPWLSSGKPLAAVAIGQLWERGSLELDKPVSTWLPEFGQGGKETITIRHLLNHTGGIRPADRIPDGMDWAARVEWICAQPIEVGWVPGRMAGYHLSCSWMILGELVRRVDGRTYDRYVREEILLPIGAADSWVGMPEDQALAYGERIGWLQRVDRTDATGGWILEPVAGAKLCQPGSGSRGPIRELGYFYEMLLGGGPGKRVLGVEVIDQLTGRSRLGMFDETFRHVMDWGLGFMVNSNHHGRETVPYSFGRCASMRTFGHGGSQSSVGFADPERDLVVAWVLTGMCGERRHNARARELNSAIYEDLMGIAAN